MAEHEQPRSYHLMEVIMRFAVILLALAGTGFAAEPREPFGAIETRPLWERPTPGATLQQRTEDALDRGTGRIEDGPTFQLRQIERDQQPDRPTPGEVYRMEHERSERIEQQRIESQREAFRQRRLERESESLDAARRRWQDVVTRENAAGGSVVDRQALEQIERDYRASLTAAARERDAALAAIEREAGLTDEQLTARREEVMQRYEPLRAEAAERREARRRLIFGEGGR